MWKPTDDGTSLRHDGLTIRPLDNNPGVFVVTVPQFVPVSRDVILDAMDLAEAEEKVDKQFPEAKPERSHPESVCEECGDEAVGDNHPYMVLANLNAPTTRVLCPVCAIGEIHRVWSELYAPRCSWPGCGKQISWNTKYGLCQRHYHEAKKQNRLPAPGSIPRPQKPKVKAPRKYRP